MANPKHLKMLKRGVEAWGEWLVKQKGVRPDLINADLSGADFTGIKLGYITLTNNDPRQGRCCSAALIPAPTSDAHHTGRDPASR